jgi:hypothetical protein
MVSGKLVEEVADNYRLKTLEYIEYSLRLNPFDTDNVSLITDVEDLDASDGLIRIGNEYLTYSYKEAYNDNIRLYVVQRGVNNTPIEKHVINSLIYKLSKVSVKQYDSNNMRDVKLKDRGMILTISEKDIEELRGLDVIIQDIKLTMINIGNELLNDNQNLDDVLSVNFVRAYYLNALLSNPMGITDVTITSISVQDENPNKVSIVADVYIRHRVYQNIEFIIGSRRSI